MERLTQKLPQGGYEAKVDPFLFWNGLDGWRTYMMR